MNQKYYRRALRGRRQPIVVKIRLFYDTLPIRRRLRLKIVFSGLAKIFFHICENAGDFRIVFALGEISPQYTLA
jgi:hypothetical protein